MLGLNKIEKTITERKTHMFNVIAQSRFGRNSAYIAKKCYEDCLEIIMQQINENEKEKNIMNLYSSREQIEAYDALKNYCVNKEEITDIDIIVPNKVVEVTFADGLKEKMVCHKDDTFNLRNCLFIAIAKHLYKKDYTFEGIECKAFELTHLKKYVKIVDSALKAFDKKQKDTRRAEENRKAELESIERKRAKRQAYKERRTTKREQAEKEKQIEIQKEAYIQAMKYMKESENVTVNVEENN